MPYDIIFYEDDKGTSEVWGLREIQKAISRRDDYLSRKESNAS